MISSSDDDVSHLMQSRANRAGTQIEMLFNLLSPKQNKNSSTFAVILNEAKKGFASIRYLRRADMGWGYVS